MWVRLTVRNIVADAMLALTMAADEGRGYWMPRTDVEFADVQLIVWNVAEM